ncbi:MAG TPA: rhamnan synthesis F family protein [Candidatus Omnitrophota bacterium]|nr:rhamnan synthesis F family protein [Candidatus Omnitrophota bacterium]HPS36290.1 rhamnan synthesis F family protein [Candidatus Omnitrophota bacterium]
MKNRHKRIGEKKGTGSLPAIVKDALWFLYVKILMLWAKIHLRIHGLRFDADWYLERNPDIALSGRDPFHHYACSGRAEGRTPCSIEEAAFEENGKAACFLEEGPHSPRIAIVVHCYYPELWPQIGAKLEALRYRFDLFITAPSEREALVRAAVSKSFPKAHFYFGANRGMDIGPFLSLIPTLIQKKYAVVCKLHTKKGDGRLPGGGDLWRKIMLEMLVGSDANFAEAVEAFVKNPTLCMVGPAPLFQSGPRLMYENYQGLKKLAQELYGQTVPKTEWGFFAGTMFWVRPEALEKLSGFADSFLEGQVGEYRMDGRLEHALERFFGLIPVYRNEKVGLLHLRTSRPSDGCLSVIDILSSAGKASTTNVLQQFARLEKDETTIRQSGLFDENYYVQKCESYFHPDTNRVIHYLLYGTHEGLWPNRYFSPNEYRKLNPDVVKRDVEPFVDYLTRGARDRVRFRWRLEDEKRKAPHYPLAVLGGELVPWETVRAVSRDERLVSIVIPAFGEGALTERCVRSILGEGAAVPYEIILVDNGSSAKDRAVFRTLAGSDPRIRLVENERNYHFALGSNIGFRHSRGGTIIFLNNDTIVTPGWLDRLIAPFSDPKVAAVQPRLIYSDGRVQNVGMVFSQWSVIPYPIYQGSRNGQPFLDRSRAFQAVVGACLAVRATDFAAVKGFDPSFVDGHEDIDLCLRLTRGTGRVCWYEATSTVLHDEGRTPGRGLYNLHNRREFFGRWQGKIEPDDTAYYRQDGFEVAGWTVDANDYLKDGVAIHAPVLVGADVPVENKRPECAHPFRFWVGDLSAGDVPCEDSYVPGITALKDGRMSVLLCAHAANKQLFGAERSFLDVLEALSSLDLNVFVTFPSVPGPSYLEEVRKFVSGVYVFRCRLWTRGVATENSVVARFRSIIDFHSIGLVHVNTLMLREPLLAARNAGTVSLMHVREIILEDQPLALQFGLKPREVLKQIHANADFLVANSRKTAEMLGPGKRVFVAPNVVRTDLLDISNTVDPRAIVFGLISSNIRKKGIFDLMEIAKLCEGSVPQAVFMLIGPEDGKDIQRLKKEYQGAKMLGNVRFAGYKETPVAAVSEVNVVLNLSLFAESFGRSVAEGMAARRPVIAYRGGALPELVQDQGSGYLVPFRNIRAVADRVEQFCKNPELIAQFGKAGREIVGNYSLENLAKALDSIYGQVSGRIAGKRTTKAENIR